jgi:hypothetical protein
MDKEALKTAYMVYKQKLEETIDETNNIKKMLNKLAIDMGESPEFTDVEGGTQITVRAGMFYNKPLAKSVREFLELRKRTRGIEGAHTSEIISALRQGGYVVAGKTDEERIRLSILKNTATFSQVAPDHWGLKDWYPQKEKVEKKPTKKRGKKSGVKGVEEPKQKRLGRPPKNVQQADNKQEEKKEAVEQKNEPK